MIKKARTDHPVQGEITSRWSPYGFSAQPVSSEELCSLFEAARWAASSYNEQPWSYLVAIRDDTQEYNKALSCLSEANQKWANTAPVLGFGVAHLRFSRNGRPNRVALHDLGLASANLCLEAAARNISIHQMAGILADRVREIYEVPKDHEVVSGLAIGYAARPQQLAEPYKQRDLAPRFRKPLAQFVFGGTWGSPCDWVR